MADDLLLQALANQRKQSEQNNMWNIGAQALQGSSQAYLQNQDPYANPNDNLIGALITGLGSGFAKGMGQQQVKQEMADYTNSLRNVAKDYYTGADLTGYAKSPYQSISDIVPQLEFGRAASQYERNQKRQDSIADKTLDFGFQQNAKGLQVGKDDSGNLVWGANPSYANAQSQLEEPKRLAEMGDFQQKEMFKSGLARQEKGLVDPQEQRKEIVSTEDKLRGEIFQRSGIDNLRTIDQVYNSMLQSYSDTTGQSDIDFIIGSAKAVDPASVVRSSEGEQIINTGGSTGYLQGILGWVKGGNKLTPETKQGLLKLVGQRRDEALGSYNNVLKETAGVAQNRGADMSNIDVYGHFAKSQDLLNPVPYAPDKIPTITPYGQQQAQPQQQPMAPTSNSNYNPSQFKRQVNRVTGEIRMVPR